MADIRDLLADIVRLQGQQQMRGPVVRPPIQPPPGIPPLEQTLQQEDPRGPSPVNRILDLLSRPLYSVAEPTRELTERTLDRRPANLSALAQAGLGAASEMATSSAGAEAALEGFTGRAKTTGSDIISEVSPERSGLTKGSAGFALDIAMDPLTYAGVGLAGRLGQATRKSINTLRGVEETGDLEARRLTEEISRRAAGLSQGESGPQAPVRGAPAPAQSDPARIFSAGPGPTRPPAVQPGTALPAGPLGQAQRLGSPQLEAPRELPKNLTPLDANAISFIKQGVSKGVPISQAGLRPLAPVERQIIEEGINAGKSSRRIQRELAEATGLEPKKAFEPTVTRQAMQDPSVSPKVQESLRKGLSAPLTHPVHKFLPSETVIQRSLSSGNTEQILKLLRTRRQQRTDPTELSLIDEYIDHISRGQMPPSATRQATSTVPEARKLTPEETKRAQELETRRNEIMDRLDFIEKTKLQGPYVPDEVARLESELRNVSREISTLRTTRNLPDVEIPSMPPQVPTTALAEAGEQIATPVARSRSTQDLLGDIEQMGTNWRRIVQREIEELPENADLLTAINKLEDMAARQTSPVFKNMINKQLRDLREQLSGARLGSEQVSFTKQMAEQLRQSKVPPSRTEELGSSLSRELSKMATAAGASSREARESKKFLEDLFNPNKDTLYNEVTNQARAMLRQSMTGKNDPDAINRINKAVYDALGEGNPKVLGRQIPQSGTVEAIMSKFATWWNAKDLRPFARETIDTARNVAAAFAKTITPMVRATKPSQRTEAWRAAQGKISPGTAEQQQLSDWFKYQVEHLLGTHGIASTESVVARSGTTMKDINKNLPVAMRFTDKAGTDDLGRTFDYSDGNWMHSWKEWDVKEPAEALYQLTRSLQLATRKNAMLDDAAARWGLATKSGEFNTPVDIDRLKGFYFPAPVAKQLDEVWRRLEKDKFWQGPGIMQFVDKVQRMWKTGVTIYSPSHHIRNLNGDLFLSALDGVVTTTPYKKAAQVMHAYKGRYKDIENVYDIMDSNLKQLAMQAKPGKVLVTTKAGHNLNAEQLYQAAESQGFLLRAAQLEDLVGESAYGTFGPKFQPLGGRLHGAAAGTSELRDHWVRMAHFIDVLGKSKQRNLRDAIEEAGRRVKKFHPDGSDLTGFEQNVMRRVLPFYSWMRKSTPLILEGLAMRPHISLAFPKGMSALQDITGIENNGPGDPFPMDQMFPDWIKEKGIGPTIAPDDPMAGIGRQETWRGETPGYVVVNPTNPVTDQLMELTNPQKSLLGGASPWLRIPTELTTGHTALGIPTSEIEGGTAGYLAQQVPPVGIGARVTGMTRPDEPWHPEQLTNWLLTGGLVTGTGPYEMQANFEIREALNEIVRENRKELR